MSENIENFSSGLKDSEWSVYTNSAWDILWQKAVSYYWDNYSDVNKIVSDDAQENIYKSNVLYYVLDKLGVKNIDPFIEEGKGSGRSHGVSFFSYVDFNGKKQKYNVINVCSKNYNNLKEGNEKKPEYQWQRAYVPINGWKNLAIDLEIKIPKFDDRSSSMLSDFVAIQRYFPFAQLFQQSDDSTNSASVPLDIKIDDLDHDSLEIGTAQNSTGLGGDESNPFLSYGQENHSQQEGDRGGSEGVDDDYAWMHFVPRLVAYNWSLEKSKRIGAVKTQEGYGLTKRAVALEDYPTLLNNLDYEIADGLNILISYAESMPSEEVMDHMTDTLTKKYNVNSYTATLSIDMPEPLEKEDYDPIALADLIAMRANQPFTST